MEYTNSLFQKHTPDDLIENSVKLTRNRERVNNKQHGRVLKSGKIERKMLMKDQARANIQRRIQEAEEVEKVEELNREIARAKALAEADAKAPSAKEELDNTLERQENRQELEQQAEMQAKEITQEMDAAEALNVPNPEAAVAIATDTPINVVQEIAAEDIPAEDEEAPPAFSTSESLEYLLSQLPTTFTPIPIEEFKRSIDADGSISRKGTDWGKYQFITITKEKVGDTFISDSLDARFNGAKGVNHMRISNFLLGVLRSGDARWNVINQKEGYRELLDLLWDGGFIDESYATIVNKLLSSNSLQLESAYPGLGDNVGDKQEEGPIDIIEPLEQVGQGLTNTPVKLLLRDKGKVKLNRVADDKNRTFTGSKNFAEAVEVFIKTGNLTTAISDLLRTEHDKVNFNKFLDYYQASNPKEVSGGTLPTTVAEAVEIAQGKRPGRKVTSVDYKKGDKIGYIGNHIVDIEALKLKTFRVYDPLTHEMIREEGDISKGLSYLLLTKSVGADALEKGKFTLDDLVQFKSIMDLYGANLKENDIKNVLLGSERLAKVYEGNKVEKKIEAKKQEEDPRSFTIENVIPLNPAQPDINDTVTNIARILQAMASGNANAAVL